MAQLIRLKYIHMFGRPVAQATLVSDAGEVITNGTLLACLAAAKERQISIENAQDILHQLVVGDGYAS